MPSVADALNLQATWNRSPGLSVAVGEADTVQGFVQASVYQRVNGVQLVPRASLALGWPPVFRNSPEAGKKLPLTASARPLAPVVKQVRTTAPH